MVTDFAARLIETLAATGCYSDEDLEHAEGLISDPG